ncbi:MAG: DNA repair protein RecN [Clostridiales bacterium]|nr:DNA repair protein RecN [Clostridiales bacterium]
MLSSLKIENIAIIESAEIEFAGGFNVLTGETGAGKSIIIDSINAVLGFRTTRELIRTGADTARVTAFFTDISERSAAVLNELEIPCEADYSLVISRTLSADGRNSCRVNGVPLTASMLRLLSQTLISIHGQQDNQTLLNPETHCAYIDAVAEDEELLSAYSEAYRTLRAIEAQLSALSSDETEKARRADLLSYQINELEAAGITPGERDELTVKKNVFVNAEKISEAVNSAYEALYGSEYGSAVQLLSSAGNTLSSAVKYCPELEQTAAELTAMSYEAQEHADTLRGVLSDIEYSPQELDEIEERLDALYRLSRKYGETEEEMLAFLERARGELSEITHSDELAAKLSSEREKALKEARRLANELTGVRVSVGAQLAKRVESEAAFLDMPALRFEIKREDAALGESGADDIEFLISANVGEPPKPLAKIASGGELSRIMLAVKNVMSDTGGAYTLIFDEVDTGVSGHAARKVGIKLRSAAQAHQVVCVTHLAQIASLADAHFLIEKTVDSGKTRTKVTSLGREGRIRELARIIGGSDVPTQAQLKTAEDMLDAPCE